MENVAAIQLKHITKRFGTKVVANRNVSLDIYRGEILSLLGENGSGKTTLMNMLAGIYYPDEGEILVNGECYSLHTLALNGADIISLGVSSGEGVGQLLQKALSSVVNEKIVNDKQALLEYVRSLI